jgi:hypothetical protein
MLRERRPLTNHTFPRDSTDPEKFFVSITTIPHGPTTTWSGSGPFLEAITSRVTLEVTKPYGD